MLRVIRSCIIQGSKQILALCRLKAFIASTWREEGLHKVRHVDIRCRVGRLQLKIMGSE